MPSYDLLITTGHNSSAILTREDNGQAHIVCGYEEERLSLKKSDSRMPVSAIDRCMQYAKINKVREVHVTHWAVDGNLKSLGKKYWDPDMLPEHEFTVNSNSINFTHHDCHAQSAAWYAMAKPGMPLDGTMIFVVDGFGNFGEHISIYNMTGYGPKLVRRLFGYDGSMGLMYQYMTAYMCMKMHEDEYKMLGYEVHIDNMDVDRALLDRYINGEITRYLDSYFNNKLISAEDPLIKLDALPSLQKGLIDRWNKMCKQLGMPMNDTAMCPQPTFENRVILAYFVQSVLEGVVLTLAKIYRPKNLICSGGVFYNVKLNRRLIDFIEGKLCVFPLAGDQGNALGLYLKDHDLKWPGHLNWGHRPKPTFQQLMPSDGFRWIQNGDWQHAVDFILPAFKSRGMVNIVRGAMEFGPRAMCNTSTIALPETAVVSRINRMNGRNTVMPMAPVMPRAIYNQAFNQTNKVHHSEEHMIVAMQYKQAWAEMNLGAAHPYVSEYTGRPQVLDDDPLMDMMFSHQDLLINTSFNVHGVPIVYTAEDALKSHTYERRYEPITTVYIEEPQ